MPKLVLENTIWKKEKSLKYLIILILLVGCSKSFDPNDLLDPTSTILKKIIKGNKK
tara:strand:- start:735 stop:902 length:168 start_codon:yes stop_codon:yes gene_type:complete